MKFARGRTTRRVAGQMNGTEAKYAALLEERKRNGEVLEWMFEAVTFVLAPATRFTPDFMVQLPDGMIEFHEVKGWWEDDARVKIKVAADKFPFLFRAMKPKAKKDGGGWDEEVIGEPAS